MKKRDFYGKPLRKGDVVLGTNILDERLKNKDGVVVHDTSKDDYIGVQLAQKLLQDSAHPEILFGPSSLWLLHIKGGARD